MSSRRSISDLPSSAISNVIKFARGKRCIPGTNTYALVCKTWRDAAYAAPDDEQLQLYMDIAALNPERCRAAARWIYTHGGHIDVLQLVGCNRLDAKEVLGYPDFGSNIQHLMLDGPNSVAGLLEAKVQLPALKHLSGHISPYYYLQTPPHQQPSYSVEGEHQQADSPEQAPQQSSDRPAERTQHTLQETCPGLLKLELELGETPDARIGCVAGTLDDFLPELLPPTLQQLRLRWSDNKYHGYLRYQQALQHLTGLQHLELWEFEVNRARVLEQLPPDCTLQLVDCGDAGYGDAPGCWVGLHPRLTALSLQYMSGDYDALAELTGLTSLTMDLEVFDYSNAKAGPLVECLTALQQLNLSAKDHEAKKELLETLQHVEMASSLRRLALTTEDSGSWDLAAAVAALPQLTALVWRCTEPEAGQAFAWQQQRQAGEGPGHAGGGPLQALRHLVGLRQLQLSAPALLNHPSGWLSALTQLTLLAVSCEQLQQRWSSGTQQEQVDGCVAAVVPQLQVSCPPSLQQVVLYMRGVPISCVEPSPLPGVSLWVQQQQEWEWQVVPQGPRPMQPCPHLRGVWELLE